MTVTDDPMEAVRKRPGMYVGDCHNRSGLHHMLWEVFSNAVDLFLAGRCTRIAVTLEADGAVTVEDDGPGMRTDSVDGLPFPQLAFTTLHRTPTLDGHAPHEHVDLHGVGLGAVSALSRSLRVEIHRDGARFEQRFARGRALGELENMGTTERTGTRITFLPDPEIFEPASFDAGVVARRLDELSYLLPSLHVTLRDHRHLQFHQPRGLPAWVEARLRTDSSPSPPLVIDEMRDTIKVEVAANWGRYGSVVESFANVLRTTEGGSHVRGLLLGLVAGLRQAAPQACADAPTRQLEDVLERGLVAIVCVRLGDPEFGEPTKSRLVTPRVRTIVEATVAEHFHHHLERHPDLLAHLLRARP